MSACVNTVVAFDRNEGASNSENLFADIFQVSGCSAGAAPGDADCLEEVVHGVA